MLAWMDLEMTGLDATTDVVVEIATLITDDNLEIVAEGPDLVIHADDENLARMNDVVRQMHTRSGLLEAIRTSTVTLEEARTQTLEFLRSHIEGPGIVPLCGNSIGTDRRFLVAHMPEIETFLNYRSIDVTTIKELCMRWAPEVVASAPPKRETHRALDDIRESIEELAHYRRHLFPAGVTA